MANHLLTILSTSSLLLFLLAVVVVHSPDNQLLTTITHYLSPNPHLYIVHLDRHLSNFTDPTALHQWHQSFLPTKILYSYRHVTTGFAAWLTDPQVNAMKTLPGFVHAHRASTRRPHTTYSPSFLGLAAGDHSVWSDANYGAGAVIGVVDYGIDPLHPSFGDAGVAAPPNSWRGGCFGNKNYCNNKLVGAVGFLDGEEVDASDYSDGHGTNCASAAAGNFVAGASVLGQASGTAAGTAPKAHVAMYKACSEEYGCADSDIVKAIDQAVEDGVDVLSVSLGVSALPFYNDAVAIAAYGAAAKGLFTSFSVGNSGPSSNTVENHAPWMLVVGASVMDRRLKASVLLGPGSGQEAPFVGESAYQPGTSTDWLPLVFPGIDGDTAMLFCIEGSLDKLDVKGKTVVCQNGGEPDEVGKGKVVKLAGGAAMIVLNQRPEQYTVPAKPHVLPVSHINFADSDKLKEYIKSASSPTVKIVFEGTVYGEPTAPAVASFSGRGPNSKNGGILKPDIIGPGHNILVATPLSVGPSASNVSRFDVQMGTSIATPMLAGVAALIKTLHPTWSPAAIKSAIMTSADTTDRDGNPITDETGNAASLYAIGAGHVAPAKASDPGLVYDVTVDDYIPYLCGLSGYTDNRVQLVTGKKNACTGVTKIRTEELNYPSIAVTIALNEKNRKLSRTVTNVGSAGESYKLSVEQPKGMKVVVSPETLTFSEVGEKLSYQVYISSVDGSVKKGSVAEGQLRWVSDKHVVRSPVLVKISY